MLRGIKNINGNFHFFKQNISVNLIMWNSGFFLLFVHIIGTRFVFHWQMEPCRHLATLQQAFKLQAHTFAASIFVDCPIIPGAPLLIGVYDTSIPIYDFIPDHRVAEIWIVCSPFMKWEWALCGNTSIIQRCGVDLLQRKVVSYF